MRRQRALKRTKRQTLTQGFYLVRCARRACARLFTVYSETPTRCACGSARALHLGRPVVTYWRGSRPSADARTA